uniref:YlqD family protein n=1 Tax=Synechococcus sp. UW106 TaxID=368495 RepID=UPI000E0FCD12|nr:YlqD family protein [Synechococcus sp. UW106]
MSDVTSLTIKRPISVRAVVTPTWKEEAERELSNGIATADQQLAQLEQEGQNVIDQVRRQSANPLDPRVQDQVAQIQQQVSAKRSELEEQKRNLLQQQAKIRELEMDQIVEQGQLESTCELKVGDNLVQKMQVAIVVKDGVVQSIEESIALEDSVVQSIEEA